ncbi:hypothetical protein [uncultured Clostridium sp.]|uniref:hypothetical protein n=1 Tax=uncultured Clostridium sp. TaxID=59620 RepID=UPI002605CFC3|nr:hypothetical protein [uncultured Clostridium sp.]
MKYNTSEIVNSCFNGKMGIGDYLKAVFGLFVGNIKDILLITLAVQLPLIALTMISLPTFIYGLLGIVAQVIYIVSIIKLIDSKAKGNQINWIEAIKLVKENWIQSSGAIIFQSFLMGLGMKIPFIPVVITVILAVSIPMGALQGKTMFESAIESVNLVKGNLLDVLIKFLVLSALTGVLLGGFGIIAEMNPTLLIPMSILSAVIGTVQAVSSLVLFYNLPTVEEKMAI